MMTMKILMMKHNEENMEQFMIKLEEEFNTLLEKGEDIRAYLPSS